MKYIIMCGGRYPHEVPRQLWSLGEERIIDRTIRLLTEAGIPKKDIYISYNDSRFLDIACANNVGVVLQGEKEFARWIDGAFPVLTEPVCYIFGDVVFSPAAIKTIIETETDDIEFIATAAPYDERYIKKWAEPLAFKVVDYEHMAKAIKETQELYDQGHLRRCWSWELWQVIKKTMLNNIIVNYTAVRDYTCDVDNGDDLYKVNRIIREVEREEGEPV